MKSLFQGVRGKREASLSYMSPCLNTKVKHGGFQLTLLYALWV